jgi:hypothetical protein
MPTMVASNRDDVWAEADSAALRIRLSGMDDTLEISR